VAEVVGGGERHGLVDSVQAGYGCVDALEEGVAVQAREGRVNCWPFVEEVEESLQELEASEDRGMVVVSELKNQKIKLVGSKHQLRVIQSATEC